MRLVTNKFFEAYIDLKKLSRRYESLNRKNEDRWDSLDLDDITTDVETPSKADIADAIRELEILDDNVINGGERKVKSNGDIEVDNRMATLDLDPGRGSKSKSDDDIKADLRTAGLDIDDNPSAELDHEDGKIRDLDFDEHGADVKSKKSNLGGLGKLDIDGIDDSTIVANIEDVYVGLASDNGEVVKGLIKRYAADIKNTEKLKEIMLTHAVQGNYESLRAICGDMTITLSDREKELDYIDKGDIESALKRLRKIARSLTGEKNTYGLIPNAIANCKPDDQIRYINIVDFLHEMLGIPIFPVFYRGAIVLHCYEMAEFLFGELSEDDISTELLLGRNGLIGRTVDYTDMPEDIIVQIVKSAIPSKKAIAKFKSTDLIKVLNFAAKSEKAFGLVVNRLTEYPSKAMLVFNKLEDADDNRLSAAQMKAIEDIQ